MGTAARQDSPGRSLQVRGRMVVRSERVARETVGRHQGGERRGMWQGTCCVHSSADLASLMRCPPLSRPSPMRLSRPCPSPVPPLGAGSK